MGTASKVISVLLRFGELASATIVAGILGRYLFLLADANAHANSRIVYTEVIAGLSILFSLILFLPFKFSFYCFVLDFVLIICWMVAFGLLFTLTGSAGCNSYWYWNSWGYYWGRFWVTPGIIVTQSLVGTTACGQWRATQAFSFIGGWCWFVSGCLGIYKCVKYSEEKRTVDGEMVNASVTSRIKSWRPGSNAGR